MGAADTPTTVDSLRALARELGMNSGTLSRHAKKAWWPAGPPFDVAASAAAIAANVRARRTGKESARSAAAGPAKAQAQTGTQDAESAISTAEAVKILKADSGAPALERARAALHLASHRLALAQLQGGVTPREIEAITKSLTELRQSESAWLNLGVAKGELVHRQAAEAACGSLAQAALQLINRVIDALGSQIVTWLGDHDFRSMDASPQQAAVRSWCEDLVREERQRLYDDLGERLDDEVAELEKAKKKGAG